MNSPKHVWPIKRPHSFASRRNNIQVYFLSSYISCTCLLKLGSIFFLYVYVLLLNCSVKQYAPSEQQSNDLAKRSGGLDAGADLLESWQNCWEELHLASERNAQVASRCDGLITTVKNRTEKQWCNVTALQNHVPKVNKGIQEIMEKLGNLKMIQKHF